MVLAVYQNSVVVSIDDEDSSGNPIKRVSPLANATVVATDSDTLGSVDLFSDSAGTVPIASLITDETGYFRFFCSPGFRDIAFSSGGVQVIWPRVAIGTMQAVDYDQEWDGVTSESLITWTQRIAAELPPVIKTAAEWTASDLILVEGQSGYASDTASLRIGNGTDLFNDLPNISGGGDGHAAVTLSSALSATISASRDLISSDTTTALSAQELALGRFRFVTSASGAVTLVLADTLAVGDTIELFVTNDDNTITIARPSVGEEGTFTTNGTDTATGTDTSMVRVGDVVSGTSVTSSQTVLSIVEDTSVTLSAAADGSQADDTLTFSGKRGVFNGSEADVTLRKGLVVIKVIGANVGIDAEILGSTTEGFGPINVVTEAADFTMPATHAGKRVRLTKATGTQTVTIPKPSVLGWAAGTRVELKATLAGATTFTLAGTGSPVFVDVAADSLNLTVGGVAVLTVVDDDTFDLEGNMVAT